MSWIWTAEGGPNAEEDEYLHECVRIEWSKALARKTRWTEEVEILKEEMRRVLRSLRWEKLSGRDERAYDRAASLVKNWPEGALMRGARCWIGAALGSISRDCGARRLRAGAKKLAAWIAWHRPRQQP
ncbi:hypothetical protein BDZ89DRAFT_1142716 [Hymenopellis radicata]|nr:hypothetical protein BDZ89DRAFT_1142716 [Hymenopellis radicata]